MVYKEVTYTHTYLNTHTLHSPYRNIHNTPGNEHDKNSKIILKVDEQTEFAAYQRLKNAKPNIIKACVSNAFKISFEFFEL